MIAKIARCLARPANGDFGLTRDTVSGGVKRVAVDDRIDFNVGQPDYRFSDETSVST